MEDVRVRSVSEDSSVTVLTEDGASLQGNPFCQVVFTDLKSSYCMGSPIRFKYKLRTGTISQWGDRIGMYPLGWSKLGDFVSIVHVDGEKDEGEIYFSTEELDLTTNAYYQMCYVTAGNFFAGVSLPFDFSKKKRDKSSANKSICYQEVIDMLLAKNAELETQLKKMCLAQKDDILAVAEVNHETKENTYSPNVNCQLGTHETVSSTKDCFNNFTINTIKKSNTCSEDRNGNGTNKNQLKTEPSLKNTNKLNNEVDNMKIENGHVLQAMDQLLARYQEMENKYKNEVVKNAGLIKRCKDIKELVEENFALKNCVKAYQVMNDGLKNKVSMLEKKLPELLCRSMPHC